MVALHRRVVLMTDCADVADFAALDPGYARCVAAKCHEVPISDIAIGSGPSRRLPELPFD